MHKQQCSQVLRSGSGRDELMFQCSLSTHKSKNIIDLMKIEWNKLPFALRQSETPKLFEIGLKTHFFKIAFNC